MNTRKAGEDFYFLHKVIKQSSFCEINQATVYPSARPSDRVPFGTGKAIRKMMDGEPMMFYHPDSYLVIREFLAGILSYYKGNYSLDIPLLNDFLKLHDFDSEMARIRSGTRSYGAFESQFYQWFDGFKVLKLLHYLRDNHLPEVTLNEGLAWLGDNYWDMKTSGMAPDEILKAIRKLNRIPFEY